MKKFLQIISVLLLSCAAVVLFGILSQRKVLASDCEWQNSSKIGCKSTAYYLNPDISKKYGGGRYAVYIGGSPKNKQLYVDLQSSGTALYYWSVPPGSNETPADSNTSNGKIRELGNHANSSLAGDVENCSLLRPKDCTPAFESDSDRGDWENEQSKAVTDRWGDELPFTQANLDLFNKVEKANQKIEAHTDCVKSALSFFLCPLSDFVQSFYKGLLVLLNDLLKAPPLTDPNNGVGLALDGMKAIANSLYAILFLVIIFANFIAIPGLDNYTIKKLLPKLIVVIILTQFSFFICSATIDIGNVLGKTLPGSISTAYQSGTTIGSVPTDNVNTFIAKQFDPINAISTRLNESDDNQGAVAILGFDLLGLYLFALIVVVIATIIVLISLFYLIFRYFALTVLTIISPLAFAAWVLPNTEGFTKWWVTNFLKLVLLYPLVMVVMVITAITVDVFHKSDSAISLLIELIVPLIGLMLIPKMLKFSGSVISSAGKALSGVGKEGKQSKVGQLAKNAAKNSAKEGQLATLRGGVEAKLGRASGSTALEARGEARKKAVESAARERVSKLSLSRQIEEARDPNSKVGKFAKQAMDEKYADLSNRGVLTGGQAAQLQALENYNTPEGTTPTQILPSGYTTNNNGDLLDARTGQKTTMNGTVDNPIYYRARGGTGGGGTGGT